MTSRICASAGVPAMRLMTRGFGPPLLVLVVMLLARRAWASPVYDVAIKSELGLPPGPVICTVCHASDDGGPETVVKPFGLAAGKLGLQKQDVPKLKEVLHQMEASNVDSDCDGIGDIAELRKGSDPNSGETTTACANAMEPPRYGFYCSLSTLPAKKSTGPSGAALASAAVFAVLLVARWSRRNAIALAR